MVAFLQSSSLHQQSRHSLSPLMKLQASEGARHRPLQCEEYQQIIFTVVWVLKRNFMILQLKYSRLIHF